MAEEWKRLLENINDVREYKGLSIISEGIGERDFTYPSSKNYYLTAKMYN